MRLTGVPTNVTRSIKSSGTKRSPELALRSTDLHVPEILIFSTLLWDKTAPIS